jgi:transposase
MLSLGSSQRFFLFGGAVDMRKGFDGLSGLVRNSLDRDPLSGEVYIFLNRHRTLVKLLHWEAGGLVIYYKRLEKGTFHPPEGMEAGGKIPWAALVLMIEGIKVLESRQLPRYHRP